MTINSINIISHIEKIVNEFKKYKKYSEQIKHDFAYNTFFEKILKILGWDPWVTQDYIPFHIDLGHVYYYGARLFLPAKESLITVFLDENMILSPDQMKEKNTDMSFAVREVCSRVEKKFPDNNIKIIWFSSITRNCVYNLSTEKMIFYSANKPEEFEKFQRYSIVKTFYPGLNLPDNSPNGVKLALWLKKWENTLSNPKNRQSVQNLLDLLVAVNMFSKSEIAPKSERYLFENLLINYYLNQNNEFLLEVDFSHAIPQILLNYKIHYNFNFFEDCAKLYEFENEKFVKILEELSCFSKSVFGLDSICLAYYILNIQNDGKNGRVNEMNNLNGNWVTCKPIIPKYIDIKPRPCDEMSKITIRVDGDDPGLVLGVYDKLEEIYIGKCNESLESKNNSDLFEIHEQDYASSLNYGYTSQIVENNIKIVNCCPDKKRIIRMILIRKILSSMEKRKMSFIRFPGRINFVC